MTPKRIHIGTQTTVGPPVTVGSVTVTPQARALVIQLPRAGFVWNRPLAVVVERDGQTQRIPVRDVTRLLQMVWLVLTATVILVAARQFGQREIGT